MRWMGRMIAVGVGSAYMYDSVIGDELVNRNGRMIWACFLTLIDYKYLLDPSRPDDTHQRVAERLLAVCRRNGGLYIKLGQGVASMNHVLPLPYRRVLAVLQDQAPFVPIEQVRQVFEEDFGKSFNQVFESFDETPVASASVAQVHRAVLRDGNHTPVAVKVQKPFIQRQFPWDMACYKFCVLALEFFFDLPLYWTVGYTVNNLKKEVDFINEANNAELAAFNLTREGGGSGLDDCYIPKVYWRETSKRILTCEWVDAVKITEAGKIEGEMGLDMTKVVSTFVRVLSEQLFVSGHLHCDPHPGNVLVRRKPVAVGPDGKRISSSGSDEHQIVLIDHGLYIAESEKFRLEYCRLWRAMMVSDTVEMKKICDAWGIMDSHFFASILLMKPFQSFQATASSADPRAAATPDKQRSPTKAEYRAMQDEVYSKLKELLHDSQRIPEEFILVGRSMNLVRATNKETGSRVNRLYSLSIEAVRGLSIRRKVSSIADATNKHKLVVQVQLFDSDGGSVEDNGGSSKNAKNSGVKGFFSGNWARAGGLRHWAKEAWDIFTFKVTLNAMTFALSVIVWYHQLLDFIQMIRKQGMWSGITHITFGTNGIVRGLEEVLEQNEARNIAKITGMNHGHMEM